MTEHSVSPASIALPDTVEGCQRLLAALQDDVASIRVQIATNDIRRQTARKGLDPDWFHRARTALRLKQHEIAQVTVHMASLHREARRDRFKDTLIEVLRSDYDDDEWASALDEARSRQRDGGDDRG